MTSENTRPVSQRVTLNDIAAACAVSRATVSLVLRNSSLVNKYTRARVEQELRRQGYVYNRAAANLRQRTSTSMALVLNDLANPFFTEFAAGVNESLAASGFITLLGCTDESPEREQAVLGSLLEYRPAGIILSPAKHSDAHDVLAVVGTRAPLLVFNRELRGTLPQFAHWDQLLLDNRHGAQLATEHLIEQGHRRIAFYGGHADSSSCRQRHDGYLQAMHAVGLPCGEQVQCASTRLEAAHHAGKLFADAAAPTAAVCYNDAVALGLMLGLNQLGIRPGRDFALTGFDDIAEAALTMPPLTTLSTAPRERGRQAATLILQRLQQPQEHSRQTIAKVTLVVRESSCPPPSPSLSH